MRRHGSSGQSEVVSMGKLVTLSSPRQEGDDRPERPSAQEHDYTGPQPPDRTGATELPQIIGVLRRRWPVIAGSTVLLTLIALVVIFQLTPRYTAESAVMLDTRKTQVVDIQAVVSGLQSDVAVVRSEVEVLKSPDLARRVALKLDLVNNKDVNPALTPPSFWSRISPIAWVRGLFAAPPAPHV